MGVVVVGAVGVLAVSIPVVEVVVVVESVVSVLDLLLPQDQMVAANKRVERAKKFFFIHECLLLVLQKFLCHY
jgi:Tfp pilus assembly major pilin PilA